MAEVASLGNAREIRAVFRELEAPAPADIVGRWDATFVGSPREMRRGRLQVSFTALRGWIGKEFVDAEHARNWVRRWGRERPTLPMTVAARESLLDGRPVVAMTYPAESPIPFRWIRDEVRWLRPGDELLGMGHLLLRGGRRLPPTPFLLRRHGGHA